MLPGNGWLQTKQSNKTDIGSKCGRRLGHKTKTNLLGEGRLVKYLIVDVGGVGVLEGFHWMVKMVKPSIEMCPNDEDQIRRA